MTHGLDATVTARAAAAAAGVEIRLLHAAADMQEVAALIAAVWGREPERPPMDPGLLVALAHSGNYVSGGYVDGVLVGASAGWFHSPARASLHSHITGILPAVAGRGVGRALKLHQRAWALERGLATITWTFDPLVARNSYINLALLGVDVVEYLPDLYGPMADALNAGHASDRLLVSWDLVSARARTQEVPAGARPALVVTEGVPSVTGSAAVPPAWTVAVPSDIEELRRRDPDLAAAWRQAQRAVLAGLLADGWMVSGFDRAAGFVLTGRR